ncbi:hypothetical protein [Ensifer canadensis]
MDNGSVDEGLKAAKVEGVVTAADDDVADVRQAQLQALRTEIAHLGAELAAIVGGTSRLAVTEAVVVLETTQNNIRRHLFPVLIAAGAIGYFWGAFLRRR